MLADAAAELREFVDHMNFPVSYSLMGKEAVSDDHPLILGMTGFWGTHFINSKTDEGLFGEFYDPALEK